MPQQTGTSFYDAGGLNKTATSLSSQIVIKVGNNPIGAIQTIQVQETRRVTMINEVGTDGSIDSSPSSSTVITGSCTRIRFDRLRVAEAFSRGFVHAHAQRYPFDIDIIDTIKGDGTSSVLTVLRNCWITNIQYTYDASNFIITDSMSFEAESIESHFAGTDINIAEGGERGLIFFNDSIEREADRGGRRGSLDAPGLITAFIGSNAF